MRMKKRESIKGDRMKVFKEKGKINTQETLRIAVTAAKERGYDIISATTGGDSALTLLDMADEMDYKGKIIIVTHAYVAGLKNDMSEEVRKQIESRAYRVITAAHALSAGERGMSTVFKGVYPLEIVAHTLRMMGQGTKVCVEIGLMAVDNGAVESGKPVVCIGGTGRGEDTVCIVSPAPSADLFKTKVNEFLCKPELLEEE